MMMKTYTTGKISAAVRMYLIGAKFRNVLQKYPDIPKQALTWNYKKVRGNP
jgi:hypothetical protein